MYQRQHPFAEDVFLAPGEGAEEEGPSAGGEEREREPPASGVGPLALLRGGR